MLGALALVLALAAAVAPRPSGPALGPLALMTFAVAAFTRPLC